MIGRVIGCLAVLAIAACEGNGATAEICDNDLDDDGNGATDCADLACSEDAACAAGSTCGDGVVEGEESCDGNALGDATCASLGFSGGVLICNTTCDGFDTSRCEACGNGSREGAEACDGLDLEGMRCVNFGYSGGALACLVACDGFDTTACTGPGPVCGDGLRTGLETCDGLDLGGQGCADLGYVGGFLACTATCDGFDTAYCESCGDDALDPGETCDGAALAGEDCLSAGFTGGSLACAAGCDAFDPSGCTGPGPTCGDDQIDGLEVCDNAKLGGATCESLGFESGVLACAASCTALDTSGCLNCGNDVVEAGEACDGPDLAGADCASLGLIAGVLSCAADCSYDTSACGASFCSAAERDTLLAEMVNQPILPNLSVGGIPLWSADGTLLAADDLIGRPEDGKFCEPDQVYENAFVWGPDLDIIVFFDPASRLIEAIAPYGNYLGALDADYTPEVGANVPIQIAPSQRIIIDGLTLATYPEWLEPANLSAVYRAVRETFFAEAPLADSFDCVASGDCAIVYSDPANATQPQSAVVYLADSGMTLEVQADGVVTWIEIAAVRIAEFQTDLEIRFSPDGLVMDPTFTSLSVPSCAVGLAEGIDWTTFGQRCVPSGVLPALYAASIAGDAIYVDLDGMSLSLLHPPLERGIASDGQPPDGEDTLYDLFFTRALNAPVAEFRPATLAAAYRVGLEQRLRDSITAADPTTHPLWDFVANQIVVPPGMPDVAQPIRALVDPADDSNWLETVVADTQAFYAALSPADQALVDDRVQQPVFIVEPFVTATLAAFSYGGSTTPNAFVGLRTTPNQAWSIGYLSFERGGVPYRLTLQYSFAWGSLTSVSTGRGGNDVDAVLAGVNDYFRGLAGDANPYFDLTLSRVGSAAALAGNPYALGATELTLVGYDAEHGMLSAELPTRSPAGDPGSLLFPVSGRPASIWPGHVLPDGAGGAVITPASEVRLWGKETLLTAYVEADGAIGRLSQGTFKGELELCPGLPVRYGDDLVRATAAWQASVAPATYAACDLVFDYLIDGVTLDTVYSLANKVAFEVAGDRATGASIWR